MTSTSMMETARRIVVAYFNAHVDATEEKNITMEDVYVVWFSKTLQNWKALVSTTVMDGMYYEITHNGDKNIPTWMSTRNGRTSRCLVIFNRKEVQTC